MTSSVTLFQNTEGSFLVGSLLAATLYGFTTLQSYNYYLTYPDDHPIYKAMVGIVWLINTLRTAFVWHAAYFYLVEGVLNPLHFIHIVWSISAVIALHVAEYIVIFSFFAWQIFQVSSQRIRWWLSGTVLILITCTTGLGITVVVHLFGSPSLASLQGPTNNLMTIWASIVMLLNALTTVSTIIVFRKQRSIVKRSNKVLDTLIKFTIGRYFLSTAAGLAEFVAILQSKNNLWYVAIEFMIPAICTNSLLFNLNMRQSLREDLLGGGTMISIHLPRHEETHATRENEMQMEMVSEYAVQPLDNDLVTSKSP